VLRDDDELNVNRRYFLWYIGTLGKPDAKVLDFGCGAGHVVSLLRGAGYDAYGVDIRWPGHDYGDIENSGLPAGALRFYEEGGRLPYGDNCFDIIVSDQVLEHVVPLESTISELERVLKPGGTMYHHFPSLAVLREGHTGIPLAHRLPPGRMRLYYTTTLRRLGIGSNKDERPPEVWASDNLDWIDHWVVYRPPAELEAVLGRRALVSHREIEYCRFRAGDRGLLGWALRRRCVQRPAAAIFRRLAFEAVEVRPIAAGS
jgi:SAM-dependent methyltransferase